MTYTFKLARRLAVSRKFAMLAVLALLVACMEETTAPVGDPQLPDPLALLVFPRTVTVETNQPIRFRGERRTARGEMVSTYVAWHVRGGGSIESDGTFSSGTVGRFLVIGRSRTGSKADTSIVRVVSQVNLKSVTIEPGSLSLAVGGTQKFAAVTRLKDGSKRTAGLVWSATGGRIDPDGSYHGGPTPGVYQVIAANTSGTLADTAQVTLTDGAQPDPSPDPQPVLAGVILKPGNPSLAIGGARQFQAYGRTSAGDSVSVAVTFRATGGTVTATGLYTAGQTPGVYSVIATSSGLADTSVVTLTAPTPSGTASELGIPVGLSGLLTASVNPLAYRMSLDAYTASNILSRIAAARAKNLRVVLNLTGGSHDQYLTGGVFDRSKWEARMNTYNDPAIKAAIAAGVADGTIIGNSVMDEPHVASNNPDEDGGNTWGPPGTMTKARVDSLCGYVKAMFPTLPVGVAHRHDMFEPNKSYRVCEFIISQYSNRIGSVTAFRDAGLAIAQRDGHAIMFGINIMNGGTQDKDGTWDCAGTGGLGTRRPNCRMTAQQVQDYGMVLGPAGCGFNMWRYDATFFSRPDNQSAVKRVADALATRSRRSCTRS